MGFLTRSHNQDLVYWGTPVNDGLGGVTFAAPVNIKGRWEDVQKKVIDASGQEIVSTSLVYLGQDVDIGGWLYRGKILDIVSADRTIPGNVSGAKEIRSFSKISNLPATDFERVAAL